VPGPASQREFAAAMRRAIVLAESALGSTSPNPIVGCVILDADGHTAGEGWHQRAGGPHAEAVALRAAGPSARGGTAVVTLEPCAHVGRTRPCAQALIAAGIARVVYAVDDPNPTAAGGASLLRAAGVDVVPGVLAAEAGRSNQAWLHRARKGRPFVTWKFAATLDGRIAAADGSSRWITGAAARHDVHVLRSAVDAIVVGTGTVLADDPQLTARPDGVAAPRQPLRVVVGRRGLPASAKVLDSAAPTLLIEDHDPAAVLKTLVERDVVSVLVEGGPTVAGAFMAAGLIDKAVGYLAPAFLGDGPAALRGMGISTIERILRWHIDEVALVGDDVRISAQPRRAGE
jgi:diaminohydroxyphosphoribosylaminopyrimidine deaminase / 5-amino-6-(5-phosphoribosylamino)uracil reductase